MQNFIISIQKLESNNYCYVVTTKYLGVKLSGFMLNSVHLEVFLKVLIILSKVEVWLLHLRGSCCSSSSLGRNRGVDVVFEHRRVAAPVFPVSNNETADSTFRGRCLRLIFCLRHLRLKPVNVQQAPCALSTKISCILG